MGASTAVTVLPEPVSVAGVSQATYDKQAALRENLEANLPQLLAVLPRGVRAEALASATMTAALDNPKLLDCSPLSMLRAVIKMATLGLRPGETADLVPIGNKVECWVRVKGVVDLAKRAGAIQWAREGFVCEGDVFEHEERETGTHFRHTAKASPKPDASNVTHVYAVLTLPTGLRVFEVWPIERVLAHKAKHAKDTGPGSVWGKHPLPMMAKTVVKAALRFAPLSPEVVGVMQAGDEIDADFEVVSDPVAALAGASAAFETLDRLTEAAGEPMTLAEAEAYTLPGGPTAWGGKGGQPFGALSTRGLQRFIDWVDGDPEKEAKFAREKKAAEIVLHDKEDAAASAEVGDA